MNSGGSGGGGSQQPTNSSTSRPISIGGGGSSDGNSTTGGYPSPQPKHRLHDLEDGNRVNEVDSSDGKPWISYSERVNFNFNGFLQRMGDPDGTGKINLIRVHFIVGLLLTIITFGVWSSIAVSVRQTVPWFIFIPTFFVISLSVHFYLFVQSYEWLPLHIIFFTCLNLNAMLWFIFDIFGTGWQNPWFINVTFFSSIFLVGHYWKIKHGRQPILLIVLEYALLNAYLFARFLAFQEVPGFIYTFWGFLIPIALLAVMSWRPGDYLMLHKAFYVTSSLFLFVIWGVENAHRAPGHEEDVHPPWFSLFIMIWGIGLALHILYERRRTKMYNLSSPELAQN